MNDNYSNISLIVATLLGGVLAGCATQKMELPAGGVPLITLAAQGVQVYECRSGTTGAAPAWAFVGQNRSRWNGYVGSATGRAPVPVNARRRSGCSTRSWTSSS